MSNTNVVVVGTDGHSPVVDSGLWKIWGLPEIYRGFEGLNKYVPKVNDYAIDYDTDTKYKVMHIDPVTLIAQLKPLSSSNPNGDLTPEDILFGTGPGTAADTYIVYLNKSVFPYTLEVDHKLTIAGSMCNYAKLFKGADTSSTGTVISRVYDSSGNFISNNVPLELVAIDNHVNYSIKTVMRCNTILELYDGEIVTAVFYSDDGHVVSKRQLLLVESTYISSLNLSNKYINNISLESPFLTATDSNVMEYPLNVPMNALNMLGVINYSDGTKVKLPVNGNRFTLLGLDAMVSTIVGQEHELVLRYTLGNTEISNANSFSDVFIDRAYKLIVAPINNSYSVKLYCYPEWVSEVFGYKLNWFMTNLDRNIWFNVSSLVRFNEITGPYDPLSYGYLQHKSVSLTLTDVSNGFRPYIHTQVVDIVLNGPPNGRATPWLVSHESIVSRPYFGHNIFAIKDPFDSKQINLKNDATDLNNWLDKIYYSNYPITNPEYESKAPKPTHFIVSYNGIETEKSVANWDLNIDMGTIIPNNKNITIRFIRRAGTTLELAIVQMPVQN